MELVVFGAGSLGSLLGGVLASDHEVTLVGRDPHVAAVRERGLSVEGAIEADVRPAATTDGTGLSADLCVVAVKAFDTESAASDLATGSFDAVLSLQNGLGNEDVLASHLDCPVFAGAATYGAHLREPGRVECTGRGNVTLGSRDGGDSAHANRIATAFRTAGIDASAVDDMPRRLWEKLAINAGINPVTALACVRNGALTDGSGNDVARAATREVARTARAAGISLSNREAIAALETVVETTADNHSSMYQDVTAGKRTEIDAINGAVVECAGEHDVGAPTNRLLAGLIRTWERENELR